MNTATATPGLLRAPTDVRAAITAAVAVRYAANRTQSRFLRSMMAKARNGTKDRKPTDKTGTEAHQIWRTRPDRFPDNAGAAG